MPNSEHEFESMKVQLLIDSIPALIHTALPDGYLDFFNQTWLEYVGLPLEDIQGWKWTACIHPDDVRRNCRTKWRASLATGEPFLYEARVRRADGEYRWMLHHKIAQRDERGNILKWYGASIKSRTAKRRRKIREQERELRQILDLTPQHLGVLGPDGKPLYANHAALDISASPSTNGVPKGLDLISFIQMIVSTFSAKERSDFSKGRPMSSKLGC